MADADTVLDNSRRFRRFKANLIRVIPRIPNDRASLQSLSSKSITDLLIVYMCWRSRSVAIRPRRVTGLSAIQDDSRAEAMKPNIDALVRSVEAGDDLGPYLSQKANRHGYVMAADPKLTDSATWDDKDFLLNVMGLHHFHLGLRKLRSGLMDRTDEVLFVSVTRDQFEILGMFDHSVFDWTVDDKMAPERKRLWDIYDKFKTRYAAPGSIIIGGYGGLGVTLAGTPVTITRVAMQQVELIREMEPKLDDSEYLQEILQGHMVPEKIKLEWIYRHLDFGLLNVPSQEFFILMRGPN